MPFATVAGFGSAATILAAHVSSYVGGPSPKMILPSLTKIVCVTACALLVETVSSYLK